MWTTPMKSLLYAILDGVDKNHRSVENITKVFSVLNEIIDGVDNILGMCKSRFNSITSN